jgi:eukaryotic-like serine/threonine-protein kinase
VVLALGAGGGWFLLAGSRQPPAAALASADTPPPTQTAQLSPSPPAAAVTNEPVSQPPSPSATSALSAPPAQAAAANQLVSAPASSPTPVAPSAPPAHTTQLSPSLPAQTTAPNQPVSQPTSTSPGLAATLTPAAPALPNGTPQQTAGAVSGPAQPAADAAAQATAAQPAAPPPIKEAGLDLSMVRQQLRQALAQSPCTMANALVQDSGAISISGFASPDATTALRQHVAGMPVASPVAWRLQPVDPVFCAVLTLLRPISAQAGAPITGLAVTLANGITTLRDGDLIRPRVTMADFPGELRVDYLVHDGSIVAIASSTPLLAHPPVRNAEDDAGPYLRELAAGVARVRQSGGKVAGTLLLVDTLPK